MKISRKKRAKKTISVYKNLFNIVPPYKVLIDSSLAIAALANKIYLKEQIPKLLNDKSYLHSTRCILNSLEHKNSKNPAHSIIRRYQMYKCNHESDSTNPTECILSAVKQGNVDKFFVATNNAGLVSQLRRMGVPVIRLVNNVLVLDKPSTLLQAQKTQVDTFKLYNEAKDDTSLKKVKKRKKKQPNPLSCLKKKKKPEHVKPVEENPTKRKRQRRRELSRQGLPAAEPSTEISALKHTDEETA